MTTNTNYNLDPADGSLETLVNYMTRPIAGDTSFAVLSADSIRINISQLESHETQYAIDATQLWAQLVGLPVQITTDADAHIIFTNNTPTLSDAITRYIYHNDTDTFTAQIDVRPTEPGHPLNLFAHFAYIHEIGHALGLGHPGPYPANDDEGNPIDTEELSIFPNDNELFTAMSYLKPTGSDGYWSATTPATPMIADIVALQSLFNSKGIVNEGDTVYGVNADTGEYLNTIFDYMTNPYTGEVGQITSNIFSVTIYDSSGYDTIDFSNHTAENPGWIVRVDLDRNFYSMSERGFLGQRINLNPGHSSDAYNSNNILVIARDTYIEKFIAGAGDDHITGNIADNWLEGRDGNDTLLGGPGNDVLIGGQGADTLDGGPGNDTASYQDSDSRVDVRLSGTVVDHGYAMGDTLTGIENLIGSNHDDVLAGNSLNNILTGNAGNDLLWGSSGDDTLIGGPGADRLVGNTGNDTAVFNSSPEPVTVNLSTSSLSGGHAEGDTFARQDTTFTDLPDIENLIGSPHNDTLIGDSRDNTLSGHAGADALTGHEGNDTASYTLSDAGVTVRLHNHTAANGHAKGDTFPNLITVSWTDSEGLIKSEQLPDIENLTGSAHDDILAGDRRDNILTGRTGNDTLYGGPGGGDDHLFGNEGNDRIYGGAGDDTIHGGPGNDELNGGPGKDVFVFETANGSDTVQRFNQSEDRIDLTAFDLPDNYTPQIDTVDNDSLLDLSNAGGGQVVFQDTVLTTDDDIFIV